MLMLPTVSPTTQVFNTIQQRILRNTSLWCPWSTLCHIKNLSISIFHFLEFMLVHVFYNPIYQLLFTINFLPSKMMVELIHCCLYFLLFFLFMYCVKFIHHVVYNFLLHVLKEITKINSRNSHSSLYGA